MKINNQYQEAEAIYPVTGLYIDPDGNTMEKAEMLLSEHRMDVYINDVLTMKLVCTPKDLPGLVLGRMVSEGMIHSSEEVEYLYICEHGTRARVQLGSEHCGLVNDNLSAEVMDTPTCCTDNKTISSGFAVEKELQHLETVEVSLELMYAFDEAFHQDMPLHECAVFTTGRLPIDMITKVIRAGIPLVASKKTPTAEAVKLAQEYGLTMIGRAKNHKMMQYTLYKE